jgi:hypothetical protein
MDEIQEQHSVFMVRGIVADKSGFPMNSNQAHTLGGSVHGNGSALEAAQRRQQQTKWMPQGPQKLGGDSDFRSWLAPKEAAGLAAEARRLRDEMWCQPCQDIIEFSDSEEEVAIPGADQQYDAYDRKPAAVIPRTRNEIFLDDRKPVAFVMETESDAVAGPDSVVTIDLTLSDAELDEAQSNSARNIAAVPSRTRKRSKKQRGNRNHAEETAAIVFQDGTWPCSKCTFVNAPLALACGVCLDESNPTASTMKVVADICRKDEIEQVKKIEVERSKEQFGFNIYGSAKQVTAKLKHIT